ncbi:hypothetical protein [Amaricoccus sp.]|uniref:hypothetical protein n=1 Tax=Amaricoccus sp. TaxID=1872485 RepID=UPI0025BEB0F8|nr:hypothetical protein [Amaricoccus sp.]
MIAVRPTTVAHEDAWRDLWGGYPDYCGIKLTQDFNATARRLYDRIGVVTPFVKHRR